MGLLGHTYAQMKEIDTHIAAAGSSAKFAGRSEDIKRQFEQIATQPMVPVVSTSIELGAQPMLPTPPPVQQFEQPAPATFVMQHVAIPAPAPAPADEMQLEFNFKAAEKNILQDIYNVLYDIKKMMQESREKEAKKETKKKISNCIICGSTASLVKEDNNYIVKCTCCDAASSTQSSAKVCVKEWNDANK